MKTSIERRTMGSTIGAAALAIAAALAYLAPSGAAEPAVKIAAPLVDSTRDAAAGTQTAVFAGGCFWGVQAVFQHTDGVIQALSGYAGGRRETASYQLVGTGTTGHAEVVQVTYDPNRISYGTLLQIFFSVAHDPTQLNRQGPDRGTQYRSAVFFADPRQKETTERYIAQLDAAKAFGSKIVTEVAPLAGFYPAEAYHQDYATLHPTSPYIATFDLPKIANLKALYPALYRTDPVLVVSAAGAGKGR